MDTTATLFPLVGAELSLIVLLLAPQADLEDAILTIVKWVSVDRHMKKKKEKEKVLRFL